MKKQAVNPILPFDEYVPDPEPYVFGGRVYVYGSHDEFNAKIFCVNDYVCWSAPVDDLSDWRNEGVIYKKTQDPLNENGRRAMYAPDVVKGHDGRYYLYYCLDVVGIMSVAVCSEPAGKYEFYGYVRFSDGHVWGTRSGEPFPFDPGVILDDDGRVYLFSGFEKKIPGFITRMKSLTSPGGVAMELESDMLTIKQGPKLLFPKRGKNAPAQFKGHEFFEASSIRKKDGKYYFIYSSYHNHELCYATSESPMGEYTFGGTLVSIGDVFLNGRTQETKAVNYLGNTHGSMVEIAGKWYVFYHRQTNRHSYSRQVCAEELKFRSDDSINQAEVTSCGLNDGPLKGEGTYSAFIACNLWFHKGVARYDRLLSPLKLISHPYFTQKEEDGKPVQFIANMRNNSVAGFKYFDIEGASKIKAVISGKCRGRLVVSADPDFSDTAANLEAVCEKGQTEICADFTIGKGTYALYFKFTGKGSINFHSFELVNKGKS